MVAVAGGGGPLVAGRAGRGPVAALVAVLTFLYLPIVVLIVMSFNASRLSLSWGGFSLRWYGELLSNESIRTGLLNTLLVAGGATALATVLGTLLALGFHRNSRTGWLAWLALTPAVLPEILLGIGLLAFYSLVSFTLGLQSVMLSHVVFGTAFVTAVVRARLSALDLTAEEAARDLGASPVTAFRLVTLPALAPGIAAGALLAFTLSIDEFVIAFFTAGPVEPTLPIVIYSSVRFGVTPEINALAALMLLVSFSIVLLAQRAGRVAETI